MNSPAPTALDELRRHCAALPSGPVANVAAVERLLTACWDELMADDDSMASYKLIGRMEAVAWNPPMLSFRIERHGGTVMGSSRGELQYWLVNVESKSATCETSGHRQLRPMRPRLKVEPLVEAIVRLIVDKRNDDRLQWLDDGSVKVLVAKIIPEGSAVKQTLIGRRKRFRESLMGRLEAEGWGLSSYPYTFSQ